MMIRTEGLCKYFAANGKEVRAVDGLTLEVHRGEVFGFLGPNGAGKTTTVRMLACLIAPTAGRAWVDGLEVGRANQEIRARVGILTETPGLYERLSARANLEIFAELYGVPNAKGQIEKYLRLLGLWERRDAEAGALSKGMKQKLAIARALLHEPPVLFLDEPTAALDPEAAKIVRDFIATLRGQGRTIFLCTHNLDEAERLCDRIGVFRQRLIAVDTADALRRQLFGRQTVVHLAPVPEEGPAQIERLADLVRRLPFVRDVIVLPPGLHSPPPLRPPFPPGLGGQGGGKTAFPPGLGGQGGGKTAFPPDLGGQGGGKTAFPPDLGGQGGGEESYRLIIGLDDPALRNPTIVQALVTQGAQIRFVNELRHSLEDVYLSLLRESQEVAP